MITGMDITPEQEQTLVLAGWQFVTLSWGQSIWVHPDPDIGQRSSSEALALVEANDG